jgi:hypothetical protein
MVWRIVGKMGFRGGFILFETFSIAFILFFPFSGDEFKGQKDETERRKPQGIGIH